MSDPLASVPSQRTDAPPRSGCTCTCTIAGGEVVLRLRGEVDLVSVAHLDEVFVAVQAQGAPVVVDLDGVGFLDSSGLRVLVRAHERSPMRVRGGTPAVRRVLQTSGLDVVLLARSDPGGVPRRPG